jgi:antitoxin component YwqK of YwqJK toxin-antitoxin module
MHGKWSKNHDNGNLFYSSNAKNGEIHGKYVSYHLNGNIADRGKLKKGYKDGNWEYFDQNGRLLKTELYRNKTIIYEENY